MSEIDGVSPDYWRDRLQKSVQQILEAVAGRGPTVILFEDLHWADGSFIELLHLLLRKRAASSPDSLYLQANIQPFCGWRTRSPLAWPHRKIDLRELPWDKTEEMLQSLLEFNPPAGRIALFHQRKGGGQPLLSGGSDQYSH
jgi:predicted ATPase